MKRDSLLFVYGTLRPCVPIPMARWLGGVATHLGTARTRGHLYDLGPYPGLLRPRGRGDWVAGDLYALRKPKKTLAVLDRYEGGPHGRGHPRFVRARCTVERRGRRQEAWAYFYRPPIFARRRIGGGDYRLHLGNLGN